MKILFIDDEKRRMAPVIEEFGFAGHEVLFIDNVDEAVSLIQDLRNQFDLVVLDISMPSGQVFVDEDTDGGARTGMTLYDLIRDARPGQKLVIYTNVADLRVAQRFKNEDQRLCRFVRKPDILPFQFVEEMQDFARSDD